MAEVTIKLEVFRSPSGVITVQSPTARVCGVKVHGSGSTKIAEFQIGRDAIRQLLMDLDDAERDSWLLESDTND